MNNNQDPSVSTLKTFESQFKDFVETLETRKKPAHLTRTFKFQMDTLLRKHVLSPPLDCPIGQQVALRPLEAIKTLEALQVHVIHAVNCLTFLSAGLMAAITRRTVKLTSFLLFLWNDSARRNGVKVCTRWCRTPNRPPRVFLHRFYIDDVTFVDRKSRCGQNTGPLAASSTYFFTFHSVSFH